MFTPYCCEFGVFFEVNSASTFQLTIADQE